MAASSLREVAVSSDPSLLNEALVEGRNFRKIASRAEMLPQRRLGEHAHHQECKADAGELRGKRCIYFRTFYTGQLG